jgi:hypothetical protein
MACSPGGLFVASSGEARQLFFGDSKEATARKLARAKISQSSLAFGGLHFLDPTCTY